MGAWYGPVAYLWIIFGCIFAGAMHDYMSGMLSIRNGGAGLPELVGKYLGGAQLLGIHLEGPYINPEKKGGLNPRCIHEPGVQGLDSVLTACRGALRMMTLAPALSIFAMVSATQRSPI